MLFMITPMTRLRTIIVPIRTKLTKNKEAPNGDAEEFGVQMAKSSGL